MPKPIQVLLFGAGNRGADSYGPYALENPDEIQFTAVAESDPIRHYKFAQVHHIPLERQFTSWRNSTASAPMILAKCCHDLDLPYWFLGKNVFI